MTNVFITSFSLKTNFSPSFNQYPNLPIIECSPISFFEIIKREHNIENIRKLKQIINNLIDELNDSIRTIAKLEFDDFFENFDSDLFMILYNKYINIDNFDISKKIPMSINSDEISLTNKSQLVPETNLADLNNITNLFINLQNETTTDPTIEENVNPLLIKAIARLSDGHKRLGNGIRLKKVIAHIKIGIPPNSNFSTREALVNLEDAILKLFPDEPFPKYISSAPLSQNLTNQQKKIITNSMMEDKFNFLRSMAINDDLNIDSTEFIKNTNKSIEKKISETEPMSLGEMYGRNIVKYFRRVAIESKLAFIPAKAVKLAGKFLVQTNLKLKEDFIRLSSTLDISISTHSFHSNELIINYSGFFENVDVGGIYSLNSLILYSITSEIYFKILKMDELKKLILTNLYKYNNVNAVTEQDIWNSIIIFIFSYFSVCCYILTTPNNIFKLDLSSNCENLFYLLSPKYLNLVSDSITNLIFDSSGSVNQIIQYANPKKWIQFFTCNIYDRKCKEDDC
jgi:hypothetical protein